MGASLGNPGEDSYSLGLCVEEGSGMGVSPYRGPVGGPGEGVHILGTLRISCWRALAMEHLSLWEFC